MSGRRSRDKGNRGELAPVHALQEAGIAAEKVSRMYRPGPDLSVPLLGRDLDVEVKVRRGGFVQLYRWIEGRDVLVVKAHRRERLWIVRERLAIEVGTAAEKSKLLK